MRRPFFFPEKMDPRTSHAAPVLIQVGLLLFGALSEDERVDIAVALTHQHSDFTDEARLRWLLRWLQEVRTGRASDPERLRLNVEIRELIFLLADDVELRRELTPPCAEDALSLCRRGADYLLLGDLESARYWYARARDRATNGDETYAALFGLWECDGWKEELKALDDRNPFTSDVGLWACEGDEAVAGG